VPPRTLHYSWFVYGTELTCGRCRPVETGDSYRTGFRLSLLCFQEAALRRPPEAVVSKGHASSLRWLLAGRRASPARWAARSKAGNKRWCQPVPSFRAPERGSRRAGRGARLPIRGAGVKHRDP